MHFLNGEACQDEDAERNFTERGRFFFHFFQLGGVSSFVRWSSTTSEEEEEEEGEKKIQNGKNQLPVEKKKKPRRQFFNFCHFSKCGADTLDRKATRLIPFLELELKSFSRKRFVIEFNWVRYDKPYFYKAFRGSRWDSNPVNLSLLK